MKFITYDTVQTLEAETEVLKAEPSMIRDFVQTWGSGHIVNLLKNPTGYNYSFFPWDKIIGASFVVGQQQRCFAAITENRLDGLLCLGGNSKFKIEYIATAPWNYHTIAKMKGIGRGLICYTIMESNYCGFSGEFYLNAVPDAEPFYHSIGMVTTGKTNKKLKEFHMSKNHALDFKKKFSSQIISE